MKKDVIVAVCVGFVLGVVVALTAINLPQIVKNLKNPIAKTVVVPTPKLANQPQIPQFTVDTPQDESIASTKTIDVSGTAKPGETVLIETADDQKELIVGTDGKFTSQINLSEGLNTVYLTVYDKEGNSSGKTLNVYYTTEKL